jgi:AcrR family transcriptional regulator
MLGSSARRTAERILEVTLDLFNRFGEPNVSTTLISAELGISPGNLYYHYPAKDELINSLFDRYERVAQRAAATRPTTCATWRTPGSSCTAVRAHLAVPLPVPRPQRPAEQEPPAGNPFPDVLKNKSRAVRALLAGMVRGGAVQIDTREWRPPPQHGGGADLLAELRIRARPAPCAGARTPARPCCAAPTTCCTC